MNLRKFHLPASIKTLGVLFALFLVFSFLLPSSVQAAQCISYATCYYQSDTGLVCPNPAYPWQSTWDQPFQSCFCNYFSDTNSCEKITSNSCWNQQHCNEWIEDMNNDCIEGWGIDPGNCCGCSGKLKPLPSSFPKPTPTSTPTPVVPSKQLSCYQICEVDDDCQGGLVCDYHVKLGQRVCRNSACVEKIDCICSWQNRGLQAAFSRLKALGRKNKESNQVNKQDSISQISQSLSSGLKRAWERLRNLKRI